MPPVTSHLKDSVLAAVISGPMGVLTTVTLRSYAVAKKSIENYHTNGYYSYFSQSCYARIIVILLLYCTPVDILKFSLNYFMLW